MTATINENFINLFILEGEEEIVVSETDGDCVSFFYKGDEVEVLKVFDDSSYQDGKGYIVFNPETNACASISGEWLDF